MENITRTCQVINDALYSFLIWNLKFGHWNLFNMALPGHRRTSSDKRRRASHFALKKPNLSPCPHCKMPRLPHRVCPSCGMYRGRQVITLKTREAKKLNS